MSIGRSVSLYSLQEPYYLGQLDLEGCVERVKNGVGRTASRCWWIRCLIRACARRTGP